DWTRAKTSLALHGSISLRVSDDGEMAIEESNLTNRQPKLFYATAEVVRSSNFHLGTVNSQIRLQQGPLTIDLWKAGSQRILHSVVPLLNGGNPNGLPLKCNDVVKRIAPYIQNDTAPSSRATAVPVRLSPVLGRKWQEEFQRSRHNFDRADR